MKRISWAAGAAVAAAALTAPLLLAAPAQAATCGFGTPAPKLTSVSPSAAVQWQQITLAGTSPAACGKIGVQRQIGSGPWQTMNGVNPVAPKANNTYSFWVELGVTGAQRLRVFYVDDGGTVIVSNYKTVTVAQSPTPAPTPSVLCTDDVSPVFISIPSRVASGKSFRVEGYSPQECGEVTLVRWSGGKWNAIGTDTPGPLNEVFYSVKQKVGSGKTQTTKKYALRYVDDGDVVYSDYHKVTAYLLTS